MSHTRAFITGLAGPVLTADERAFLGDSQPWGVILFRRNVETPEQLHGLTEAVREILGTDTLVFVDQEGGRVQRLGPPHWPAYPPAKRIAELYAIDPTAACEAAWLHGRLIAEDLRLVGITADCYPVVDIGFPSGHDVIGARAYGTTPDQVAKLADAAAQGLCAGGVQPIVKHIPGHGRAEVDSHISLPVVSAVEADLQATDFAPFRALAGLPMAMTAHVVYTTIDAHAPATTSAKVIREVIRGAIGFDGLLMTDDVSMGALSGTISERCRESLAAGCDMILHCNGDLSEMQAVADAVPALSGDGLRRANAARVLPKVEAIDLGEARDRFGRSVTS